tara:strand:- start:88 stop:1647 length:1560 start_codon:yes stop_codon:yes gene_type:complete
MKLEEKNQYLNDALKFHDDGELDRADELYLAILQIDENDFNANHLHGCILSQKKQYDEAINFILKSLEINNQNYEANNNLALAYKNKKEFDKAEEYFHLAIALNKDDPRAYFNLANLFTELKDYMKAIDYFQKSFNCDKNFIDAKKSMGEVYQYLFQKTDKKDYLDNSINCFYAVLEHNPEDIYSLTLLGLAQLWKGDIIKADKYFNKAHKLQCDDKNYLDINIKKVLSNKKCLEVLLKHEYEQLTYIDNDTDEIRNPKFSRDYYDKLKKLSTSITSDDFDISKISYEFMQLLMKPLYNKAPKNFTNCLINRVGNIKDIEQNYNKSNPEIGVLDNFLTPEALDDLQKYCRNANIFKQPYEFGYVGAFLTKGLSNKFFLKLTEDMRTTYPGIFKNHRLTQAWIFKYDNKRIGTKIHSDQASINVNFWISPDNANLDVNSGGLIIWDKIPEANSRFKEYNSHKASNEMLEFLETSDTKAFKIPYKENRCVIFNSKLFHCTDVFHFEESYINRRINVTLLFD